MITAIVQETVASCQQLLQSVHVTREQIGHVLLAGGSCSIPYVQEALQIAFQHPISIAPLLGLVVCQGTAYYATAHEIYVVSSTTDDEAYPTIEAALEQASPKSRILVRPGTYRENLELDKAVEIVGLGPKESILIEGTCEINLDAWIHQGRFCSEGSH